MLFIHPMWDHENQRIGKQKCTPFGYALHVIADLLGMVGLLLLIGTAVFSEEIADACHMPRFQILAIPFGIGLVSEALYRISWVIAHRRGFEFDYESSVASWKENGVRVTYGEKPDQRPRHQS